jgi:hypothetical protein
MGNDAGKEEKNAAKAGSGVGTAVAVVRYQLWHTIGGKLWRGNGR